MPGFPRNQLLFAAGGDVLARYGTLVRRYQTPARGGEGLKESFTRAGAATAIGYLSPGVLGVVPAAANVPRVEWARDPISGLVQPYWLLEATRTNAFTKSQKFDDGIWTKTRSSITPDATTAPDGTATADKLVEDATVGATHVLLRATPALTDNTQQPWSCFAKAAERSWIRLGMTDKSGVNRNGFFNLGAGVLGTLDAGVTARITPLGNGWNRCSIMVSANVGATAPVAYVGLATGDTVLAYNGDGASGVYLWGAQFEPDGQVSTSYIATDVAAGVRGNDLCTVPWYISPGPGWIYTRRLERGPGPDFARVWQIGTNAHPLVSVLKQPGVGRYFGAYNNGVNEVDSFLGTGPAFGDVVEDLLLLYPDGSVELLQSINGAAQTSGGRSAAPTAPAFPASWTALLLALNQDTAGTSIGYLALSRLAIGLGPGTLVPDIATARAIPV